MEKLLLTPLCLALLLASCKKDSDQPLEDASTFTEMASLTIGGAGAAEITAYDPETRKLFVVTNSGTATRIDVVDLSNPGAPRLKDPINVAPFGGGVNSVSVHNGKLAAAVEANPKTDAGKVVVFNTKDHSVITQVTVGALPDMITFSKDGKYLLTANEGEPNGTYTIDPVGSVSIIDIANGYAATTLDFSSFASQLADLQSKELRKFGPNVSFAQDMEPEYITISDDAKTAWVTLQENNAIARIDIQSKTITALMPLGFKDYNTAVSSIDPSDRDNAMSLAAWKIKGMYQPDAIAFFEQGGVPYLFTANEGDVREWAAFAENKRVSTLLLDPTSFPDGASLRTDAKLGRLNVTNTMGDTDGDGDFDELYSFGARSFSVWNGLTGAMVWDSGNELEKRAMAVSRYDDGRSDDKGVEPEGITIGQVGNRTVAFIGMERADVVALYDISDPTKPFFLRTLLSGDAPEGLTFIPAVQSPNGKSLLVASSENDGMLKIYTTN